MQCNIDSRGRAYRLVMGFVLVALGAWLTAAWAWPSGQVIAWLVSIACLLPGLFGIVEGWAGWCAIRAMGFRTRV